MKKLLKYFRITPLDVIIYSIRKKDAQELPDIGFQITAAKDYKNRLRYLIEEDGVFVHQTLLEENSPRILKLIKQKGPAVSSSVTNPDFRGKSIYPFVLNLAARNAFRDLGATEVFGVVSSDNASSIRGLEKAGFRPRARIRANRFLIFYLNLEKQLMEL